MGANVKNGAAEKCAADYDFCAGNFMGKRVMSQTSLFSGGKEGGKA